MQRSPAIPIDLNALNTSTSTNASQISTILPIIPTMTATFSIPNELMAASASRPSFLEPEVAGNIGMRNITETLAGGGGGGVGVGGSGASGSGGSGRSASTRKKNLPIIHPDMSSRKADHLNKKYENYIEEMRRRIHAAGSGAGSDEGAAVGVDGRGDEGENVGGDEDMDDDEDQEDNQATDGHGSKRARTRNVRRLEKKRAHEDVESSSSDGEGEGRMKPPHVKKARLNIDEDVDDESDGSEDMDDMDLDQEEEQEEGEGEGEGEVELALETEMDVAERQPNPGPSEDRDDEPVHENAGGGAEGQPAAVPRDLADEIPVPVERDGNQGDVDEEEAVARARQREGIPYMEGLPESVKRMHPDLEEAMRFKAFLRDSGVDTMEELQAAVKKADAVDTLKAGTMEQYHILDAELARKETSIPGGIEKIAQHIEAAKAANQRAGRFNRALDNMNGCPRAFVRVQNTFNHKNDRGNQLLAHLAEAINELRDAFTGIVAEYLTVNSLPYPLLARIIAVQRKCEPFLSDFHHTIINESPLGFTEREDNDFIPDGQLGQQQRILLQIIAKIESLNRMHNKFINELSGTGTNDTEVDAMPGMLAVKAKQICLALADLTNPAITHQQGRAMGSAALPSA